MKAIIRDGLARFGDGFSNVIAGLGLANIKTAANTYMIQCTRADMDDAYRTSTWFGKIVDIPADDSVREWRAWQGEKEDIEKIEAEEKRLQVRQKVRQALIWSRLYGGAVIIPGGLNGDPSQPLNYDSIRPGQIKFLSVVSRYDITAGPLIKNPLDENYGEPEYYEIVTNSGSNNIRLHPSRVVRITGKAFTAHNLITDNGWGDPIWLQLRDAVTNADMTAATIAALMTEAKIDVVKLPDVMTNVATAEYESLLTRRFQLAAQLKSVSNVLLLDKDDDWNQKQIKWDGLPGVMESFLSILSGAADIPVTRLIGTSAKGFNATGEGDLKNYYDSVRAKQELVLQPLLNPLDEILRRSAGANDPDMWYEWKPLFQLSEKELSEIDKRDAETANIYASSGLVPIEALEQAVQNRMIESGRWPGLDTALKELPDVDNDETDTDEPEAPFADAEPRPLYVRRNVVNADAIKRHYERQGLTVTVDPLHITIIYSKMPVDWFSVSEAWNETLKINRGGARYHALFGPPGLENSLVLMVKSDELEWRFRQFIEAGAVTSFPDYQPHVTLRYEDDSVKDIDLDAIEPYQGVIELGPELFSEIK